MAVYDTDSHKNTFKDGGGYTNALVGIQVAGISPVHSLILIHSSWFRVSVARFTIWDGWRDTNWRGVSSDCTMYYVVIFLENAIPFTYLLDITFQTTIPFLITFSCHSPPH